MDTARTGQIYLASESYTLSHCKKAGSRLWKSEAETALMSKINQGVKVYTAGGGLGWGYARGLPYFEHIS